MMKLIPVLAIVGLLTMPAKAIVQCTLTAVPLQISSEGLAEPVGEVMLRCAGGQPGGALKGTLQISLGGKVANAINAQYSSWGGIPQMHEYAPGMFVALPVTVQLRESQVIFENLNVAMDVFGMISLKISGIRAEAGGTTFASMQFYGNEQLFVPTPTVTVAFSKPGLLASLIPAVLRMSGPITPTFLEYTNLVATHAPMVSVRVTEGFGASFVAWSMDPNTTNGTRILVKLTGVPAGSRVIAPDAVAGSSALQPTTTGDMGGGTAPGLYDPTGVRSLMLVRVKGSDANGAGGFVSWVVAPGPMVPSTASDMNVQDGTAWAVYEVQDQNKNMVENAQIPIWIFTPLERPNVEAVVRPTVSLAPVSDQAGSIPGAPLPRFRRGAPVGQDCELVNDCTASYWPKLTVTPVQEASYSLPSGGPAQAGYVTVRNDGGGLLEWKVAVRYRSATGWLTADRTSGFNTLNMRYDVNPKNMAQGTYDAELVYEQANAPVGANATVVIPVKLVVTAPLPPPLPSPTIQEVVNPATGWGAPAAPGAQVVVKGTNFLEQSTVTIGGKPAQILGINADSITAIVPVDVALGRALVQVFNLDRFSQPYAIEVWAVAPGLVSMRNENGALNGELAPANTGSTVELAVTGLGQAVPPVWVKIHDVWTQETPEPAGQAGMSLIRIKVPDYFPTMSTVVMVCGQVPGQEGVCSHPKDIWVKAAQQ
ncbi:MAG: IPT/TIG domain-containing protein [Acidobacteria bacterium]|nr:IPT/TIG domain-containing protein [Acidobacteriota bacterium]